VKDPPGDSPDEARHHQAHDGGGVEAMEEQHFPSSFSSSSLLQRPPPFLLLGEVLALEGGALGGGAAPRGRANVFQDGVEAVEEVLEVSADRPEHSLVLLEAEAEELLSEMLPQLAERDSWGGGGADMDVSDKEEHRDKERHLEPNMVPQSDAIEEPFLVPQRTFRTRVL